MKTLTVQEAHGMLKKIANEWINHEEQLGEIDRKIGDGDHGIGMANGARAILQNVTETDEKNLANLFKQAGMAMMESMGGASGVIFSALFLGVAKAAKKQEVLTVEVLASGMENAVKEIKQRGKAAVGDKTMLDALVPASEALSADHSRDFVSALAIAREKAAEGVEQTKRYPAKHGRSKFLGERAIGFQDAGATSVALMCQAMYDYVKEEEK